MKINDEGTSNAAHWHERAMKAEARLAEAEAENARLVAANKARDEFLRGHRYKHSEVDGYIDLCESQMATLKARLADAERNEETLLGMIRHQRDVLRECLPYINESMAGRRPGRSADNIRAAVKALTADAALESAADCHALLAQVDALAARLAEADIELDPIPCPDCADLRALLKEKL